MKHSMYLFLLILIASCSSNSTGSNYEDTIANYVQTDKRGTKYDMKFKVLEINETGMITVEDSITALTTQFEEQQNSRIKDIEALIEKNKRGLEIESLKSMIEFYEKSIARQTHVLDSIKALKIEMVKIYEGRKPDEVLVHIVQCKYSIVPPTMNTTVEETFDFYLSQDGTKVYEKKRVK